MVLLLYSVSTGRSSDPATNTGHAGSNGASSAEHVVVGRLLLLWSSLQQLAGSQRAQYVLKTSTPVIKHVLACSCFIDGSVFP